MVSEILRRYRRYVPYPLVLVVLLWLRPNWLWGSNGLDIYTDVLGASVASIGEILRLWAWGSNAGVTQQRIRRRGAYAMMRHPLYVGNWFILCGMLLIFGHPAAFLLLLPPFAALYYAVARREEIILLDAFPAEYAAYVRQCQSRFLPSWSALAIARTTSFPFDWRFALAKEYESVLGIVAGIAALNLYEANAGNLRSRGWDLDPVHLPVLLATGLIAAGLYLWKWRRHAIRPVDRASPAAAIECQGFKDRSVGPRGAGDRGLRSHRSFGRHAFRMRGWLHGALIGLLVLYLVLYCPHPSALTLPDYLGDSFGALFLLGGQLLRVWAVKHAGRLTRSHTLKAEALATTGPYAIVRNPIYVGNFMLGVGFLCLTEALLLLPIFIAAFAIVYRVIVQAEEAFLSQRFGHRYRLYCRAVDRWVPGYGTEIRAAFSDSAGPMPPKEYGTIFGTLGGAALFEVMQHGGVHERVMALIGYGC